MNYGRLVAAAVAATVVDAIYGFLVYGMLLTSEFARYPAIFRPTDAQTAYMPALMAGILIGMLAATWIYAKGYEGGSGLAEGVRFGLAMGVFIVGYVCLLDYAMLQIGRRITASLAGAGLVEWVIVGAVIGLVYKSAAPAKRAL